MKLTDWPAKLCPVKKLVALVLAFIVMAPTAAIAMGSGDKYSDAQTGLTYSVYKPSNTLGLKATQFSLLTCQPGEEEWIFAQYGGTKRYLQIMQTMAGVKCSDPGLSKYLRVALINGVKAKVYAYCDPTQISAAAFKKCGVNDIARVGGYLIFTTKALKGFKATEIQVQGFGGITYSQLLSISKSLKTTKASGSLLPEALPPEMVNPATTASVSVRLGNSVVFAVGDAENWNATLVDPTIAQFIAGGDQGTYTTNPAIKTLKVGTTTVHITHGSESFEMQLTVTG